MNGISGYLCALKFSFASNKHPIDALSTTEAEYIALAEVPYPQQTVTKIYVDNQRTIKLAHDPEFHSRNTKNIDSLYSCFWTQRYYFIRAKVQRTKIVLV